MRREPTLFDAAVPDSTFLTREQVIERIASLNASATPEFLAGFEIASLARYLAHLETIEKPRGSAWTRGETSPAIVGRDSKF